MERYGILSAEIKRLLDTRTGERLLVAIDGPCAAGKTTLATLLAKEYDCNLFHMDHFFLRPEQRTGARLGEVGGNVDYERFYEEVLVPLRAAVLFSYQIYDCGRQQLTDRITVPVKRLNLVEGSYSMHPYFKECYDWTCCLRIDREEQVRRIRERNGEETLKRFREEWIPKEDAYLETMGIWTRADLVL